MLKHISYDAPNNVVPFGHGGMMLSVVNKVSSAGRASRDSAMQVIAVTGGKGGVGKTNIAVNLAVSMSMEGLDVMLFDADLGLANVDIVLGMQIKHTLADVVSGERRLKMWWLMALRVLRLFQQPRVWRKWLRCTALIRKH